MSEGKQEIVIDAPVEIQRQTRTHPLVKMAMERAGQLDTQTIREMMQLQREWETGEAKREFDESKTAMMREMPSVIAKDSSVEYNGVEKFKFASLARILDVVGPHLANHDFALSWTTETTDRMITVRCKLTHAAGHVEETALSAPPDNSGGKNAVQAIGSTTQYLKRYTASCLLGLTTRDELDADKHRNDDAVDISRNLQAVAYLESQGITRSQAVEHVQREVEKWTASDLDALRELVKKQKENGK